MSGLLTLLAQAQFLDPSRGPSQSGEFRISPTGFIAIIGAGFLVAIAGHVIRSRPLIAFGIALIFGATVLVPIGLTLVN